jgi:predicted Holliday junction resolvase-like endonuclease
MTHVQDLLTVVLVLGLLASAGVAIVLAVKLATLRASLSDQVETVAQQRWEAWRASELGALQQQYQNDLARAQQQLQTLVQVSAENEFNKWKATYEQEIRQDAIERSRAVIAGKATEHLIPYLPGFGFNPKDARFVGAPVDLIVFDGLDAGDVQRIVFIEVKTGGRALRRASDASGTRSAPTASNGRNFGSRWVNPSRSRDHRSTASMLSRCSRDDCPRFSRLRSSARWLWPCFLGR